MPASPERSFDQGAAQIAPKESEKSKLESVVESASEREMQEKWRAMLGLDLANSENSLVEFKKQLEIEREKAGQTATRTQQGVERFRELRDLVELKTQDIKVLREVIGLYDNDAWEAKIQAAKASPDITDEKWQAIENESREFATRRAEADAREAIEKAANDDVRDKAA